jgi:two-component system, NtrC family, sensor kinase
MRFLSSQSLAFKLSAILGLVVAVVAVAIGGAMINRERQYLRDDLKEDVMFLTQTVALTAPELVLRDDSWTLYKTLRDIVKGPDSVHHATVVTAMVLDPEGRILAHIYPALFPIGTPLFSENSSEQLRFQSELGTTSSGIFEGQNFIEGNRPIRAGGKILGLARIRLSTAELDEQTASAVVSITLLTIGIAIIGIILGSIWSTQLLRPLHALAQSMEKLGRGTVRPLPVLRADEIGQLVASFNRMIGELEEKSKLTARVAENEKIVAFGRIAAGVAHEVGNPLAGMLNCLSTLRAQSNDPDLVARYLPMIERELKKIEALIKDLLAELRVEDAREIADASCLEEVRDLVAAELRTTKIELVWDNRLAPGEPVNRPRMQQILLNLMHNSIQAMPTGGTLCCRFWSDQSKLIFEVEDTGHGIPSENIERIFEPFFTSRNTGTGLGLWIVLRLVQSMQGEIDVNSALNKGTRVRVQIPRESKLETRPT